MRSYLRTTAARGRRVPFELVYGDRDLLLTLHFDVAVEERLVELLRRGGPTELSQKTRGALANRISEGIAMIIEGQAMPPSEKQIKYAISIARELSLELPADVLQFRDAMTTFLTIHAEHYRRRKGYTAAKSIR